MKSVLSLMMMTVTIVVMLLLILSTTTTIGNSNNQFHESTTTTTTTEEHHHQQSSSSSSSNNELSPSNIEKFKFPLQQLVHSLLIDKESPTHHLFEKIEKLIKRALPNYLVQSSPEPTTDLHVMNNHDHHHHQMFDFSSFQFETNYQYSKTTDEYSTFKIMTKQEQNLILFILGTATRTFTDIFGSNADFINQPENAFLKNLIEFSDSENYEHDLLRLKIKLFFKQVERNIKDGNSKEKIGWLFKKHYKLLNSGNCSEVFDYDSQLFASLYDAAISPQSSMTEESSTTVAELTQSLSTTNTVDAAAGDEGEGEGAGESTTSMLNDRNDVGGVVDCESIRGVLFIGGLYTDYYPFYFNGLRQEFGKVSKCTSTNGSSNDPTTTVNFRISQVDTGKGIEQNAEFLRSEIVQYFNELNNLTTTHSSDSQSQSTTDSVESAEKSAPLKKILLIGHSKGACDATYALAKYENELKPYVRGLISLQAPYAGSALANDIAEFGAAKILLLKILIEDVLGGDLKAIEDLSYDERRKQISQYPYPSATFPCVAMSSYEESPKSLMYPAISYLKARYNVSNDGLVPTMDGYIPGCKNVVIKDMDHSGSAFTGFPNLSKYDPAQLSTTFIQLWDHYFNKKR